uniref:BPI-like protein n=1 Tax=Trepomonas sp. PC1 TaxID=1076344 RepID=A0A146KB82_9EUKA|eukprot:JAP94082.1 BPI-like protein [Trepomonas sp. PC1]
MFLLQISLAIDCYELKSDLPNITINDTNIDVNIKSHSIIDVIQELVFEYAETFYKVRIPDISFKSGNMLFEINDAKVSDLLIQNVSGMVADQDIFVSINQLFAQIKFEYVFRQQVYPYGSGTGAGIMDLIFDVKAVASAKLSVQCKDFFEIEKFVPQLFIDKFSLQLPDANPFLQAMIMIVTKMFKQVANEMLSGVLQDLSLIMNQNMFKMQPLNFVDPSFATDKRYVNFQLGEKLNLKMTGQVCKFDKTKQRCDGLQKLQELQVPLNRLNDPLSFSISIQALQSVITQINNQSIYTLNMTLNSVVNTGIIATYQTQNGGACSLLINCYAKVVKRSYDNIYDAVCMKIAKVLSGEIEESEINKINELFSQYYNSIYSFGGHTAQNQIVVYLAQHWVQIGMKLLNNGSVDIE